MESPVGQVPRLLAVIDNRICSPEYHRLVADRLVMVHAMVIPSIPEDSAEGEQAKMPIP